MTCAKLAKQRNERFDFARTKRIPQLPIEANGERAKLGKNGLALRGQRQLFGPAVRLAGLCATAWRFVLMPRPHG